MKTCTQCNINYPDEMKFCKTCGGVLTNYTSPVNDGNAITTESKPSNNNVADNKSSSKSSGLSKGIFLLIGIISTSLIMVVIYFIFLKGS